MSLIENLKNEGIKKADTLLEDLIQGVLENADMTYEMIKDHITSTYSAEDILENADFYGLDNIERYK